MDRNGPNGSRHSSNDSSLHKLPPLDADLLVSYNSRRDVDAFHRNKSERRASQERPHKPYVATPKSRSRTVPTIQSPTHVSRESSKDEVYADSSTLLSTDKPPPRERPVCLVRGSIFIEDYIQVSNLVSTGEKVTSSAVTTSVGGKAVLQAIAISRAGQRAELLGAIGQDGEFIPRFLAAFGVGSLGCRQPDPPDEVQLPSGRAITQYTPTSELASIVIPGANGHPVDPAREALLPPITHLLVQNELDADITQDYIDVAHLRNITVVMNPSPLPYDAELRDFPWHKIAYLVITETDAELFVDVLNNLQTRFSTAQPLPIMHTDPRYAAGLLPPVPKRAYATLCSLIHWPPLAHTGIVIKLSAIGGGILAVLPSTRAPTARIYFEPAPPKELALTGRSVVGEGSVDTMTGYFAAGLMEFALFDRFRLDENMWQAILEKAVMASFMTPTSFPPTPPLPVHAIPHFPDVHQMLTHLHSFYTKQLQSNTSLHPYPSSGDSGRGSHTHYPPRVSGAGPSR